MSLRMLGRLSAWLVSVLVGSGCYGPDPTAIDSGLDGDQSLNQLSPAEAIRLCDATNEVSMAIYTPEFQAEAFCSVEAAVLSPEYLASGRVDSAVCERARDSCSGRGEADGAALRFCDETWMRWFGTCSANVEIYEKCMTAGLRASVTEFLEQYSCEALVEGDLSQRQPGSPPECASIAAECGSPQ